MEFIFASQLRTGDCFDFTGAGFVRDSLEVISVIHTSNDGEWIKVKNFDGDTFRMNLNGQSIVYRLY